ncbi:MAG: hypothetical protein Kow0065_21010 [Methylomicrobium sp.]
MKQRLVVIGNGMAGMRTIETLIESAPDLYDITVFGAEPYGNYNRILLTPVLYGEKQVDDIMIHDFAWYRKHGITLHCGPDKTVVDIDRQRRIAIAQNGTEAHYDKLLIATGSLPLMLPVPGRNTGGVLSFRDIGDVEAMIETAQTQRRAVVLGGGLLGLEAASGLTRRGMDVTVVNRANHLLNRQIDCEAAQLLQSQLESKGLTFKLGCTLSRIVSRHDHIHAVELSDGSRLLADLLIFATGIEPNIALAQKAGLTCNRGIVVDDALQTSDPAIYSVGECIEHRGELFGLVAPVYEQAHICAQQLSGRNRYRYQNRLAATRLKVSGIDLFSVGDFDADAMSETIVFRDPALHIYKKVVVKEQRITGAVLYGDTGDAAWYVDLLENRTDISSFRDSLLFGRPPLSIAA